MKPETPERRGDRCSSCGAPLSTSIDGLCGACLMRLAMLDSGSPEDRTSIDQPFEGWPSVTGRRIGNYELVDEIARGGMGIVYRARQLTAGRIVALKVMLPYLLHLPNMLQRFRQEVEAVAQLDHVGILPIYEVGEYAGLPFFSMKFADGGGLDGRIDKLKFAWREIAAIMAKVARAVEHAHGRGVLHRDLKPANILFDAAGEPLVADFGIAKFRAHDRALTLPASALGSPHYMAPEQISAQFGEIGPASDIYSLGAVLYELLTGQPPIVGDDPLKTLHLVPTYVPLSGTKTSPELPIDLDAIALKCLAKRPAERYASAAALASDLERWLKGGEVSAWQQMRARQIRRHVARAATVVLVIAGLIGAGFLWRRLEFKSDALAARQLTAVPQTLAVLAFRNLGGNTQDDYLTSSVTDDLLYELRQIRSLAVIPFRIGLEASGDFRSGQLAKQFGVNVALDGDFTREATGLKVRARLWDARSGKKLWESEFAAPAGDLREVREQIATTLVTRLQIEVGNDVREQFGRDALTQSAAAYDKYLRARYLIRWRRPETLAEAARLLRETIALDPKLSRAHSALAYCYALWIGPAPPQGDHWLLARDFAQRAAALNPTIGEPYAVLGDAASIHGDLVGAELQFRKAMAIDPNDPATLHFYAIHLYSVGRLGAALNMERRSVALDSTSPQPMMWLAMLTTTIGDKDEARRLWQKTDDLGAARPLAAAISRLGLGQTEFLPQWYPQHWSETKIPEPKRDTRALIAGVLEPAQRAAARAWMQSIEAEANPAFLITHYALLGDADSALRIAEDYKLVDDYHYHYQLANIWSPQTAVIRRDPRFGELMQRWGFVDYWRQFGPADLCAISNGSVQCR